MEENKRKQILIKKMLEAKKIEINNNQKNVVYKLTTLFSKPKKPLKDRIDALEKTLEKKDVEELEYMILQKEGSLLLLEKRVKIPEEKNTLKEIIDELNTLKKGEGKREKIAREIGFKKKEIKKLKKEVEEKVFIDEPKEKIKVKRKPKKSGKENTIKRKIRKKQVKKTSKRKKKGKKDLRGTKEKKSSKKTKERKIKKKEIKFTSPLKELKQKREEEIKSKRQKALETFHDEFTSGKETYVSIKGGAQIIAGKQQAGATPAPEKSAPAARTIARKTNEQLNFDIKKVQQKMKNLKSAFFHRQISEQDYKKKLFEYQEDLNSLEMEKKRPQAVITTQETKTTTPKIKVTKGKRGKKIVFDSGLKTIQQESIKFATKHTPKSKQKVQEALKEFSKDFDSKPYFTKDRARKPSLGQLETVEPRKPTPKITGIIKRIAPSVNPRKTTEMENKLADLMQRKKIGENEIRKELEFVSAKELMNKFDKIVSSIEQKYNPKESPKIVEDTGFDETIVTPQKKSKKIEGEIKDIHEKKIITDFDKLLKLVEEKGKIKEKEAATILKLSTERIRECYLVLEKNNLLKLEFPVFGGTQIISKEYVAPKKKKKKKKGS